MAEANESLSILYWNTYYRAAPTEQLEHLAQIEEQQYLAGIGRVIICLSEVNSDLAEQLARDSYEVVMCASGRNYRLPWGGSPASEYLAIVQKSGEELLAEVTEPTTDPFKAYLLRQQRGFGGVKLRSVLAQRTVFNDQPIGVYNTHLSYPFPSDQEVEGILAILQSDRAAGVTQQVLGGDMNTLLDRQIVRTLKLEGFIKLVDPAQVETFPLRVGRIAHKGWELDHVFVSPELADQAEMQVGERGPSNHRPLIVRLNN